MWSLFGRVVSHRCPSTPYKMPNELSFTAILPATPLFYANLTALNFVLVIDIQTDMNDSFSFLVLTSG